MGQDGEPRGLSLDEDAVLQHLIVVVRVVVGLLQSQEGLIVMNAVGHHDGFGVGIHHEQVAGVGDALFTVVLSLLIEEEGCGEGVGHGLDFLIQL